MQPGEFLCGIKAFSKSYNQVIQAAAAPHHLSLLDADILLFLHNNPAYDTATDISSLRMLAKSGVSASVENLSSRGLLECREDQGDRRRIHLRMTDAAVPVIEDLKQAQDGFFSRFYSGISEEERTLLSSILKRMTDNLTENK